MRKRLRISRRWVLALLLALLCLQGLARTATADTRSTRIQLTLPADGKVGDELLVQALVTQADGLSVAGVTVVFSESAEFANVGGEIELGQAATDDRGMASLAYVPRSSGVQTIIARFAGNDRYGPAESSAKVSIGAGPQLHKEEAGVRVPGIGVWLLSASLGVVWIAFLVVTVLLGLIAGMGTRGVRYGR